MAIEVQKNTTGMTQEQAAKLRNGYGKNHNGGKYVNPNIPESTFGDGLKALGIIALCIYFFINA